MPALIAKPGMSKPTPAKISSVAPTLGTSLPPIAASCADGPPGVIASAASGREPVEDVAGQAVERADVDGDVHRDRPDEELRVDDRDRVVAVHVQELNRRVGVEHLQRRHQRRAGLIERPHRALGGRDLDVVVVVDVLVDGVRDLLVRVRAVEGREVRIGRAAHQVAEADDPRHRIAGLAEGGVGGQRVVRLDQLLRVLQRALGLIDLQQVLADRARARGGRGRQVRVVGSTTCRTARSRRR